MRIGIMGGTFDPIHLGHLATAEAVRESLQLEKILFIPAKNPPHKTEKKITSSTHRVKMVELAIESNPFFELSTIEIEREGLSYSLLTIDELLKIFGAETEFFFITGADAVNDLPSWYRVEELLSKCHFVAATRGGSVLNWQPLEEFFGDQARKKIYEIQTPALQISSTEIRDRIKNRKSIRYLVPDVVLNYIIREEIHQ